MCPLVRVRVRVRVRVKGSCTHLVIDVVDRIGAAGLASTSAHKVSSLPNDIGWIPYMSREKARFEFQDWSTKGSGCVPHVRVVSYTDVSLCFLRTQLSQQSPDIIMMKPG